MCGRYAFALSNEEVYEALQNQLPEAWNNGGEPRWERQQDYRPNYNVAPRQRMPVMRRDAEHGERVMLETMQWGLIPHWTKHPPTQPLNTINARSEALLEASSGGMWHSLKGYKRCIIPAQGYYEWLKRPSSKIAHFTRLPFSSKDANAPVTDPHPYPLVFFAGLWDTVKYVSPVESHFKPTDENDKREPYPTGNPVPLSTFTILTTTPSKDLEWLHDRMPCMLSSWEEISRWLDLGDVKGWEDGKGGTGELLRGKSGLECYPVPPEVGRIGTNSPTYIQPVSERADGIKSFFQKQSPSKPKVAAAPVAGSKVPKKESVKEAEQEKPGQSSSPKAAKDAKTEIKSEITPKDEEKNLGDDSNAPNPSPEDQKPSGKRKRTDVEGNEEEKKEDKGERKGGHQTKVVRKNTDEGNKEQPSITSFFQSPSKKTAPPLAKGGTTAKKKGKK